MTGAFLFGGGFWLLLIWFVIGVPVALILGKVIGFGDTTEEDEREREQRDERDVLAAIYDVRRGGRRVDNVVPLRHRDHGQKW